MKTIKEQLNELELNLFYCVTIWSNSNRIQLQGDTTNEIIKYCKSLGVENFELQSNGHLKAEIDNIEITLT